MNLRAFVFAAFSIAVVTLVAAFAVIIALVSAESSTIDSIKRNQAIYRDLTQINYVLLKQVPPDATGTIDLASRHIAKIRTDAGVEGDYVLTHRLSELAEALRAWRELHAQEASETVRAMIVFQVRQHILESLTASLNVLGRAETRLSRINRVLGIVTVLFMFVVVGLATATGWVLRWQIILPLQSFTRGLTDFRPGRGSLPQVTTRVMEIRDLDRAFRDVSERLDVAIRELEEREARYKSLFYNTAHGVISHNAEGLIDAANTAACRFLGCVEDQILGSNVYELLKEKPLTLVSDEGRHRHETGEVETGEMLRPDGSAFAVEFSRSTFASSAGDEKSVVVFHDISERIRSEAERDTLKQQLMRSEKLETLGTLAGGIAHDVNNVLLPIINYGDLILETDADAEAVKDYASKIVAAGQRAADLMKQILTFSRQTGQDARTVALGPIIEEVLRFVGSTSPSNIEIVTQIEAGCPPVLIDPSQIHQVVMNLCVNAIQAMEKNGGILTVSLRPSRTDAVIARADRKLSEGEYLRITVADTGPGMDARTRERIFDPFFTTKGPGKGTGLGLATVHGIVIAHNGTIAVDSEPGRGTTFDVFLPAQKAVDAAETVEDAPTRGGHDRILVVDDETAITEVLGQMLTRLGYDTTLLNDSAEALDVFSAAPDAFDLVVTDQTMPKMTGKTLARKMLEIRADLPVVIMTGFSDTESDETFKGIGVREFLFKPVRTDQLDRAIRSALNSGTR